jgi:hypothetical protein
VADEAVKTDAHASVAALSQAKTAGIIAPGKKSVERMMASIQMRVKSVVKKESQRANVYTR